jgi:hypothetical protein
VKVHNVADRHGTDLQLLSVPPKVLRLLDITRLSDLFKIR